ncbi:MAG TPA: FG-GAP-like repeat-containing protein [Candidatus Latescibacteria bacterium]|nr:FG-GAP-like repeat-containing protein [Candidatus Latescibacterota bacterium]
MPAARKLLLAAVILTVGGVTSCAQQDSHEATAHTPAPIPAVPGAGSAGEVRFTEVGADAGLGDVLNHSGSPEQRFIVETMSAGASWLDADGDGWLDLFFTDGSHLETPPEDAGNRLLRNEAAPDGFRRFRNITAAAGVGHSGWAMGSAVGDVDGDGDPDLYVTYWGQDRFYRNLGGTPEPSFVHQDDTGLVNPGWGTSATFADFDNDGSLDLYVANYLHFDRQDPPAGGNWCAYKGLDAFCGPEGIPAEPDRLFRNTGDGRFEDRSTATGIDARAWPGLGVVAGDFDDDGDTDVYVANDSEPNLLFRNGGDWQFTEAGTRTGVAYSVTGLAQAGMGVDAGDWDNDGDLDLYVSNFSDDVNTLYANDGTAWFTDATNSAGLGGVVRPFLGWSTAFLDYDLDGWLDLFVANGHVYPQLRNYAAGLAYDQRSLLYHNEGGRFSEIGQATGLTAVVASRGAAVGDYDNDGDPDIVVVNLNTRPHLYRNDGGSSRAWVGLSLRGTEGNGDAIGARVWLHTPGSVQMREIQRGRGFLGQSDRRLQFGLGDTDRVDSVVVRWPTGTRQVVHDVALRRYTAIVEGGPTATLPMPEGPSATTSPIDLTADTPAPGVLPVVDSTWDAGRCRSEAGRLYGQGRYAETAALLERAIELEPSSVRAHINLALVHHAGLGDTERAAVIVRRALEMAPQRPEALHLLGKIHLSANRSQQAVAAFSQALRVAPRSGEYAGWLGLAHERSGDTAAAITAYGLAARLAPWDPRPHLNLARIQQRQGDATTAEREYAAFDSLAPVQSRVDHYQRKTREYTDSASAPYLLARAYEEQGRLAAAEGSYRKAIELERSMAAAHHGLGRVLQRRNQLDSAVAAFEAAVRFDPAAVEVYSDLGQAYHFQHRYDQAISAYLRAIERDSGIALVHSNLGMAYAMAGELQKSSAAFRRGVELDPGAVDARDGLAQVLLATGDRRGAEQQWRAVLRLHPGHTGARRGLARLRGAADPR